MNRRSILAVYKKKSSHFRTGVTGFKSGNLFNREAPDQVNALVRQLAEQNGISEDLKLHRPLEWAAQMQALQAQAEEIVCSELICI